MADQRHPVLFAQSFQAVVGVLRQDRAALIVEVPDIGDQAEGLGDLLEHDGFILADRDRIGKADGGAGDGAAFDLQRCDGVGHCLASQQAAGRDGLAA